MKSRNSFYWLLISISLFLSFFLFSYAYADDDDDDEKSNYQFRISEAKWDEEKFRLKIKGNGKDEKIITFFSSDSSIQLSSTTVKDDGEWKINIYHLSSVPCRIRAEQSDGQTDEVKVEDAPENCDNDLSNENPPSNPSPEVPANGNYTVLAANDLGMHCADQDYRIFSILPPYNVLNAQVIQKGNKPLLMSPANGIELTYKAVNANNFSNFDDPTLLPNITDSFNSTSLNQPATQGGTAVYKNNFWDYALASSTGIDKIGFIAYEALYPTEVLSWFPSTANLGLPAPDVATLYFGPDGIINSGDESLLAHQAAMPGLNNVPQPFNGYVQDLPFFVNFPFGYRVNNFNRYTAEGIPISSTDDNGNLNPYPLMKVEAKDSNANILATIDVVVPVASEADCAICHSNQDVCDLGNNSLTCNGIANINYPNANFIETFSQADAIIGANNEQKVINSAKTNILRLHDYKHLTSLAGTEIDGSNGNTTPNVVCANCHYSPALDLAHLGPTDLNGKEQTQHISMSRAMHSVHGSLAENPLYKDAGLFPIMPPPGYDRTSAVAQDILMNTCYNCHPGKKAKCLRGAMGGSGTVCQDCHGQLSQVGDDFSKDFPIDHFAIEKDINNQIVNVHGADLNKRISWVSEPKCDSCHVGDVVQVSQLKQSGELDDTIINDSDKAGNIDQLRLLMTYRLANHKVTAGAPDNLPLLDFPNSRFASTESLYRLSGSDKTTGKGHGGLSCEGCHGSTHAIWPNQNPYSNDNKAANDLQGHSGPIIECNTCHEGNLGNTLAGPHGMHPVGDTSFSAGGHEDMAERNKNSCRACHGLNGEGSVLSRAATARVLSNEGRSVRLNKGDIVSCTICHENKL